MERLRERYSNWVRSWDGIQGYRKTYSISARIGDHFCPYCGELLQLKKKKQVVNSESEEAINFDFSGMEGGMVGNIEFNWDVFYCAKCDTEISVQDMSSYEREMEKLGGNVDFDALRARNNSPYKKKEEKRLYFIIKCLVIIVFVLICIVATHFSSCTGTG